MLKLMDPGLIRIYLTHARIAHQAVRLVQNDRQYATLDTSSRTALMALKQVLPTEDTLNEIEKTLKGETRISGASLVRGGVTFETTVPASRSAEQGQVRSEGEGQ